MLNETHDPDLNSWVNSANKPKTPFPIQNLPYAAFRKQNAKEAFRGGVAIGDQILDLAAVNKLNLAATDTQAAISACSKEALNEFMGMGTKAWSTLRAELSRLLREGSEHQSDLAACLVPQAEVEYKLPCKIGDYTDFYTSIYHATAVGKQFRPDNPLLPNYKWVPIGYHGRSSSIGVSGQVFNRPCGQLKAPESEVPVVSACKRLDYELEMGIFIGPGNEPGQAISLDEADQHVFGLCLFNDWSARDIQGWEYQPLGPFLAKNFASTISPWIVTLEALAPFRCQWTRDKRDPQPLPYLESELNRAEGALDIQLESLIQTEFMRKNKQPPESLSKSSFKYSYWTMAQMVAHHTINGCNLQSGDLFGSGTQSGPKPEEAGSLLELSKGGTEPLTLASGEQRSFVEDGDAIILRGECHRDSYRSIGFGDVISRVLPAREAGE